MFPKKAALRRQSLPGLQSLPGQSNCLSLCLSFCLSRCLNLWLTSTFTFFRISCSTRSGGSSLRTMGGVFCIHSIGVRVSPTSAIKVSVQSFTPIDHREDIAKGLNDWNLNILEDLPDTYRFVAFHPTTKRPSMAADLLDHPRILGFKLQLLVKRFSPDDERLFPLYELVSAKKKPSFFMSAQDRWETSLWGLRLLRGCSNASPIFRR